MTLLLASAARATVGGRSGQEDAFRLWPAEGVVPPTAESGGLLAVLADGMGGHTGGAVASQTVCKTFTEVFAAASAPPEARLQAGPAGEQRGAGQRRRAERCPEGHGLHDRGRVDRRSRHPLDQRRRFAPPALPPPRRHPPQRRPLAGLVPGRAGAPEQDHAVGGAQEPQSQCAAFRAHGLQDRAHRYARRAAGAARRRLGRCWPATGSARCPATRSPTWSTTSAKARPRRWRRG